MKKISFGILICLCLLCRAMPVTALANAGVDTHVDHPVCGATCTHVESHTTATTWVVWDGTNKELSNSCYQISSDTEIINVNDTISISGEVNLCLNGHTLEAKSIVVESGASLTLCDCSAEQAGKLILSPELSEGNITGIMVPTGGEYTQYGGAVELSSSGTEAGQTSIFGVYSDGGDVNLHGGSITVDCRYDSGEPAAFAVNLYGGTLSATGGSIIAEAKSGDTEADWPYACGIDLNDGASAEISGVTVSASAQGHWAGASAVGCFSGEAMIHSGTFNASAKGESSEAFGVYIDGGKVKVEDGSFISEAEGMDDTDCYAYGIRCAGGSAVVSGGTFSTTTEGDGSEAYGIFLKNASASVTSGIFTASTEGDESESYGLYAWNNDLSTENSIAVSGGSFLAEVKGEENESCVACGIYIDDSCEKTTAVLSDISSFHARAECLYSNAYAVFNECPGLSITGGRYTAEAECTDFGYACGVDDSAGIAITGGSVQTVSGWSAYGVSFDKAGGSVSGISASATAPHATAVFFSGDGSVTDCTLTATGTEDFAASALALYNPVAPPAVTLSGGTLTAAGEGESSVGVEISDGVLTLEGAPIITADRAQISIVPTDSSGEGWYNGGTVRLGDSFSGGGCTLVCEAGLTGFTEGTVVVENVSAEQAGLFTLLPMQGVYADWALYYGAERDALCIGTIDPLPAPSYPEDDSEPTYKVELPGDTTGGVITARPKWAEAGDTVTLTVTPEDGYDLTVLEVADARGNMIEVTDRGDSTYTFRMPGRRVTVTAAFAPDGSYSTCPGDHTCPIWSYTDIEPAAWYHDGLHYIIEEGLMTGYGNGIFKPDANTSRAMIAEMLWRLEGSPVVNCLLNFEDVKAEAWYTEAIRWAKSEGIIGGYGNGYWGPDDAVTREQMVTILWRYAQYKGYDVSVGENTNILSYDDAVGVAEYAIPAMQWTCGSGMVQGMNDPDGEGMILAPESKGTRAQIATVMMRFCKGILK